ncbi:glutathione S-transferase [Yoonia litorea]|nr:glutathione S-transferase [Yoonia litorea]
MTYQLHIGDRTFSSWSLRGWLMLKKFGLPFQEHMVGLYSGTMKDDLAHLEPARTVPVLQTAEGAVLTDSLAMAETLAERHPDAGLYPVEPAARALARSMVAEMHSSFHALRQDCPMILRHRLTRFSPAQSVQNDLERIFDLWSLAKDRFGSDGPWLFGNYSLADVFYAPVAMRITAYGLPAAPRWQTYIAQHLKDPDFLHWRSEAMKESHEPWPYPSDLETRPWPDEIAS